MAPKLCSFSCGALVLECIGVCCVEVFVLTNLVWCGMWIVVLYVYCSWFLLDRDLNVALEFGYGQSMD